MPPKKTTLPNHVSKVIFNMNDKGSTVVAYDRTTSNRTASSRNIRGTKRRHVAQEEPVFARRGLVPDDADDEALPDVQDQVLPESWQILISQRRRWINSTVHNLCELVVLSELVGFCCFSMKFFVFIDLVGTIECFFFLLTYTFLIVLVGYRSWRPPVFMFVSCRIFFC